MVNTKVTYLGFQNTHGSRRFRKKLHLVVGSVTLSQASGDGGHMSVSKSDLSFCVGYEVLCSTLKFQMFIICNLCTKITLPQVVL